MRAISQLSTDPRAVYMRDWYARRKITHPEAWRESRKRINEKYRTTNSASANACRSKYHRRIRSEVLDFFGRACTNCGFDNPMALHVDHVNNDGYMEKSRYIGTVHKLITSDPDEARRKYQILCANCNEIKRLKQYPLIHWED